MPFHNMKLTSRYSEACNFVEIISELIILEREILQRAKELCLRVAWTENNDDWTNLQPVYATRPHLCQCLLGLLAPLIQGRNMWFNLDVSFQGPGSQPQEKPVHVPPPMMEAIVTLPAKKMPSQTVNKLEEVAASTPLSGTLMHTSSTNCKSSLLSLKP